MSDQYAFDPFSTLKGVMSGQPFKIMPVGKFYRGERVLDITEDTLREMASNIKSGLPRFRVPINADHRQGEGKIGTIQDAEFNPDGEDGPGLYATKYELTDKGKKLISEDGYDAVSAEVVWDKNGSQGYQDPETGKYHNNVLTGLAITPTPYFGHSHVALYSANAERGKLADDATERLNKLEEQFREFDSEMRQKMAKSGMAMDDGSFPIEDESDLKNAIQAIGRAKNPEMAKAHIIRRAKALGKSDLLPENWTDTTQSEKGESMSDTVVTPEAFAEMQQTIESLKSALTEKEEKFAAEQKAAKETAEKLAEENKTLSEKFAAEQKARRLDTLKGEAEAFAHLPIEADKFAEHFYALENALPETAKWISERFAQFETMASTGNLFEQVTHRNAETGAETFESAVAKVLKEEYKGDNAKYIEAANKVAKARPDLFNAYSNTYTPAQKELR